MDKRLSTLIASGELGVLRWTLLILSLVTAYFTYKGVSIGSEHFSDKGDATIFAIGSGVVIFAFWDWMFRAVHDWKSARAKKIGCAIVAAFMLGVTALSSQFNVAGVNRGEILNHHNELFIGENSAALGEREEALAKIKTFRANVRQKRDRFQGLGQSELQTGGVSGSPDVGAVYATLLATSERLDRLDQEIEEFERIAGKASADARIRLDRIRAINASDKAFDARARAIKKEADLLRADFAKMDADNLKALILRTVQAMPGEVGLLAQYSRNPAVREQQIAALQRLQAEIQSTADSLTNSLEAQEIELSPIAEYEQISVTRAVRKYWQEIIPEWAGGLALDWNPLALFGLMLLALSETKPAQLERMARLQSVSIYDAILFIQHLHLLNKADPNERLIKQLFKDVFGELGDDETGQV